MYSYIFPSTVKCVLNLQKKRSQKISMLERKQGQHGNLHYIPHKFMKRYSQFLFYFSDEARKNKTKSCFQKYLLKK